MTNCCYSFSLKSTSVIMENSSLFPRKKVNHFVLILTGEFKSERREILKMSTANRTSDGFNYIVTFRFKVIKAAIVQYLQRYLFSVGHFTTQCNLDCSFWCRGCVKYVLYIM